MDLMSFMGMMRISYELEKSGLDNLTRERENFEQALTYMDEKVGEVYHTASGLEGVA